jgi:hypothetical protein
VLFTILPAGGDVPAVAGMELPGTSWKVMARAGGVPHHVDGALLLAAGPTTLRAARFDLSRLEPGSEPVPVLEEASAFNYAVSRDGLMVYVPGSTATKPGARSCGCRSRVAKNRSPPTAVRLRIRAWLPMSGSRLPRSRTTPMTSGPSTSRAGP